MTSDLAETIARWKERNEWLLKHSPTFHPTIKLSINDQLDLAALINAAESGIAANKVIAETNDRAREAAEELAKFRAEQARDAALEECEQIARRYRTAGSLADTIANAIAALRRPA